jgi:hypothetical protein
MSGTCGMIEKNQRPKVNENFKVVDKRCGDRLKLSQSDVVLRQKVAVYTM